MFILPPPFLSRRFPLLAATRAEMLEAMSLPAHMNDVRMTTEERETLLRSLMFGEPELVLTPSASDGRPDPRLVELARLLGRQAARQNFAAEMNRREPDGS